MQLYERARRQAVLLHFGQLKRDWLAAMKVTAKLGVYDAAVEHYINKLLGVPRFRWTDTQDIQVLYSFIVQTDVSPVAFVRVGQHGIKMYSIDSATPTEVAWHTITHIEVSMNNYQIAGDLRRCALADTVTFGSPRVRNDDGS